ncbi:chemotaxis protein CheW [Zavarzinia sp. CC-PAN008]|uniref:chemotaxis protein CheW n=1 Tax=Zavarzinia sp. CC-PAN008 TaxID=3243332 RepID=UPI003F746B0A
MPPDPPARQVLDWAGAKARLDAIEAAIEGSAAPTSTALDAMLEARARDLARPVPGASTRPSIDLVAFHLGQDRLGIAAGLALAVVELTGLTPVPGLPPHYPGIVLHRGSVYPVLDLGLLFRRPRVAGAPRPAYGILVRQAGSALALAADAIAGIERVDAGDFAPATDAGIWQHLVDGVVQGGTLVLDVHRLLADPRLVVHDKQ